MSRQLSCSKRTTTINESLQPLLIHGLKGIEKESLRMTREGINIIITSSGCAGSALTHPNITTDYSEALLELITPALSDAREMLGFLDGLASIRLCKYQ